MTLHGLRNLLRYTSLHLGNSHVQATGDSWSPLPSARILVTLLLKQPGTGGQCACALGEADGANRCMSQKAEPSWFETKGTPVPSKMSAFLHLLQQDGLLAVGQQG